MSNQIDAPTERHAEPIPVGTRVRHLGQRYPSAIRDGTATVLRALPWSDGTWEYEVDRDPAIGGGRSWWASYHAVAIRRLEPTSAVA